MDSDTMPDDRPNLSKRIFRVGALAAALALLLFFVNLLIFDRQGAAQAVERDITQSWGAPQTVAGPWLIVPHEVQRVRRVERKSGRVTEEAYRQRTLLTFVPETVDVDATLRPQTLSRALYELTVYDADVGLTARFLPQVPDRASVDEGTLKWADARLMFGVSDPRGLSPELTVTVNGERARPEAGIPGENTRPGMLSVPLDLTGAPTGPLALTVNAEMRGSRAVDFVTPGQTTRTNIESIWPHPSFQQVSPTQSAIGEDGFRATWEVSNLATGTPLVMTQTQPPTFSGAVTASVALAEPVNLYSRLARATKYGVLFIALSFLTYLLFDIIGDRRVPLLGYALMGLGLVLLFVLLTALSEHISFLPAYLGAAATLTLMIALYSRAILGGTQPAAILGGL
ncbi:MAG: cell envelope integrity protein CreD, partial [Pseudomonadota bacterium]